MTVLELLDAIGVAYQGATPDALKAFKGGYYARLQRHEGEALQGAWDAVSASFKPTVRQPFPIVEDFAAHLPAGIFAAQNDGGSIRGDLEDRQNRRNINIQRWIEGQGRKIKDARPYPVYAACMLLVIEQAARPSWRMLTAAEIDLCEQRALSQTRVRMFGPLPATNDAWDEQIAKVREAWAAAAQEAA